MGPEGPSPEIAPLLSEWDPAELAFWHSYAVLQTSRREKPGKKKRRSDISSWKKSIFHRCELCFLKPRRDLCVTPCIRTDKLKSHRENLGSGDLAFRILEPTRLITVLELSLSRAGPSSLTCRVGFCFRHSNVVMGVFMRRTLLLFLCFYLLNN